MTTFHPVCDESELPPGRGRAVTVNGVQIAVFNANGTFLACSNVCPHRGGPLAEGDLDGMVVTCPWHGFQFDIASGESAEGKPLRVPTYDARVTNGKIEIGV